MKKITPIIMLLAIVLVFTACNSTNENTQMPNPIMNVESAEDFSDIGIKLYAPESATDAVYNIVANSVAEIYFTLDEREYTLRASKTNSGVELHGIYEEFDDVMVASDVDADNYVYSTDAQGLKNKDGAVATATIDVKDEDSLNVTLYTSSKIELDNMHGLINDICNLIVVQYEF